MENICAYIQISMQDQKSDLFIFEKILVIKRWSDDNNLDELTISQLVEYETQIQADTDVNRRNTYSE